MANKHFIRIAIDQLAEQLASLERVGPDSRDINWKTSRDVFFAEVEQVVGLALPPESPLISLLKNAISENSALKSGTPLDSPGSASDGAQAFGVVMRILDAARRWNEARLEEDATSGLAEDVDRILTRRFLKYPVVQVAIAALIATVGFAIFGVFKFQGMEFNVKEQISQRGEQARQEIDKQKEAATRSVTLLQEQTQLTADKVKKLDSDITTAKERVSDLTISAIKDLSRSKLADIEAKASSVTTAIESAQTKAVANIQMAGRLEDLNTTVAEAKRTISSAAQQRANEVKVQITPEFNDTIKKDFEELKNLDSRLRELESRRELLAAAFRTMGAPDSGVVGRLAAIFNQTVLTVYAVIGLALLILVFNVGLMFFLWRKRSP